MYNTIQLIIFLADFSPASTDILINHCYHYYTTYNILGVNQDSHFMLIPSRDISKEVDERPVEIDIVTFKSILIQALDSLHGKVAEILASFL